MQKASQSSRWARLSGDHIAARNRYLNVEPFITNRIKLQVADGVNDYINASPIRLGDRRYIATQGPKDTSVNHFYRMVQGEIKGPAVVVMLTQTHESGKEKCFQYYPLTQKESPLIIPPDKESGDGFRGKVELVNSRDDVTSRSEVRELKMHIETDDGSKEEKKITHLLFSAWPDFLVPEGDDRTALVHLVELSATLSNLSPASGPPMPHPSSRSNSLKGVDDNPRIIHCSAGVGRSGTFIALDYLLDQLHKGAFDDLSPNKDPIAETVEDLRQQRMMMVQGETQFFLLYDVLREHYLARAGQKASSA